MGNSKSHIEKLVIDYFNHGRNTPPGTWHTGQAAELKQQRTARKQKTQRSLRQKGGHDDDKN